MFQIKTYALLVIFLLLVSKIHEKLVAHVFKSVREMLVAKSYNPQSHLSVVSNIFKNTLKIVKNKIVAKIVPKVFYIYRISTM